MKLPISKRLMACAAWVDPGQRVADIGTDHGYLAIYLLRSGRARRVLAADIAPQPLERARENARRFGVQAGLSFHQCDGVRGLPRDFDVLLMAGLGAETMIQILQGGPWLRTGGYRLIFAMPVLSERIATIPVGKRLADQPGGAGTGRRNFCIRFWRQSRAASADTGAAFRQSGAAGGKRMRWSGSTWPFAAGRWNRWFRAWPVGRDPNMNITVRLFRS